MKLSKQKIYFHALKVTRPRIRGIFSEIKRRATLTKIKTFIQKRPFISFFISLFLLGSLIFAGSMIFAPKPLEEKKPTLLKEVEVFKIGSSPKISTQAQVEKSGVIKVSSQMPGIVTAINVLEGDSVSKGKVLISLASNYQGGNAMSLSRQIAGTQLNLSKQTFETQKDLIKKQREIAERTDANADELRDIANRSLDESRSLLDLNESLLSTLNQNLSQYEATNSGGLNQTLIFQTNSQRSQFQSVITQLRQAIRNTEFQSASDRPPAQLSDLQREIALKNLDIQEKSLEANKQITGLQYQLALVNESQMFPAAPFEGVVERVHVKIGQAISPGTPLVTLTQTTDDITLDAKIPEHIAKNISQLEQSTVHIHGRTLELTPYYVSQEATDGQLYSALYLLGDEYKQLFTDGGFVQIDIPVGAPDTNSVIPFVPIDAVFQTQEESIIYVVENGKAGIRKVQLGDVQGRFVGILEGLNNEDPVILTRNVVEGDQVRIR